MHIWEDQLSETDKEVIRRGGYGGNRKLGLKPVLIIIDAQYNYFGANRNILEQLDEYPSGVGEEAWKTIKPSLRIVKEARERNVPIIYTRYVKQTGGKSAHEERILRDHSKYDVEAHGSQIIGELAPTKDNLVIDKSYASAFFGTPLINYLIGMNVDTVLIAGGTTSGCVRATAIDSSNFGFKTAIIEDCVFDRISASHKTSLLDFWMKYGSVIFSSEVLDYFKQLYTS